MNRLECEIIAWKNVTNPVIDLQANTIPGIRANVLVILVKILVDLLVISVRILASLLVKLTELGQGGPSGPGLQGSTNSWACYIGVLWATRGLGVSVFVRP